MAYRIYTSDGERIAGLWRTREGAQAEVQHLQSQALQSAADRYERQGESAATINEAARTWSVDQYEIREVENTPEIIEQLEALAALGITE